MWTIEKCDERATRNRWLPVPGVAVATREEAAQAASEAVQRELREPGPSPYRTHRYRVAALALVCLVLQ